MANTPEAEEQEEEQQEQQQGEPIEDEIKEYVPPKQAKMVYHTKANKWTMSGPNHLQKKCSLHSW